MLVPTLHATAMQDPMHRVTFPCVYAGMMHARMVNLEATAVGELSTDEEDY